VKVDFHVDQAILFVEAVLFEILFKFCCINFDNLSNGTIIVGSVERRIENKS